MKSKSFESIPAHEELACTSVRRRFPALKPDLERNNPQAKMKPRTKGRKGGRPSAMTIAFLNVWHGIFSGAFFVAMMTGAAFYDAHVFAGVLISVAIAVRLAVGVLFPKGHALLFPFPRLETLAQGTNGFRRFVSHLMGLSLLTVSFLASITGWYTTQNVEIHSALSYFALALVGGHVVLVIVWQGWKKMESRFQA